MPFQNEHRCRLRDPGSFMDGKDDWGRVSREHNGKSYDVVRGRLKSTGDWEDQAFAYPIDTWSADQARSHCESHDGLLFEAAKPEKEQSGGGRYVHLAEAHALAADDELKIDRDAGIMRGVSFISRGPAIGHGFLVDDVMLEQVAARINARKNGVRSRLTHPEPGFFGGGTDGIEVMIGRALNARISGTKVRGDIKFGKYAASSPRGNLREYLFDLAEEDPEAIGLSIVFSPDEYEQSEGSGESLGRVKDVFACDFVGDPGANPEGLLSEGAGTMAKSKDKLQDEAPDLAPQEGETREAFVERFTNDDGMKAKYGDGCAQKAGEIYDAMHPASESQSAEPEKQSAPPPPDAKALAAQAASEALAAERERRKEIIRLGKEAGAPDEWTLERAEDPGMTPVRFKEVLEAVKAMKPTQISVGEDRNIESLGPAIEDAICLKTGRVKVEKPHERAAQFKALRLSEIARRYLEALGVPAARDMSRIKVAKLCINRLALAREMGGVGLAMHTTSDFPFILANVLGKTLRQSYELATTTWPLWCSRNTAPDFKQQSAVILSSAPALVQVVEGAEYKFSTMTEGREVYTLLKYGRGISFSWEMLINDDLSAFTRIVPQMGAKAKYLEDQLVYGVLTANAAMADGVALFAAGHANVGAGVIAVAGLTTGYNAMALQTDLDGASLIENGPAVLIVPKSLEITAMQLINAQYDPAVALNPQTPNPFASRLKIAASPHLDGTSTAIWYLSADPGKIDTVQITFLEGEEQPVVDSEETFDADSVKYKVRHCAVAKALDWRGLYRSTGV